MNREVKLVIALMLGLWLLISGVALWSIQTVDQRAQAAGSPAADPAG